MAKYFKPKVASANDQFDGDVVYLDAEARWVRDIRGAAIAETEEDAEALLVRADQPGKIVGSYLVDVTVDDDGLPFPSHFREKFRQRGPSNRTDLGPQAETDLRINPLSASGGI